MNKDRIKELEKEIEELKKMVTPQRKSNYQYRKYGDYIYKRLEDYGFKEMSQELSYVYTAVRKISRLRYFGDGEKRSIQIPTDEKQYQKMCNIIDDIIPPMGATECKK